MSMNAAKFLIAVVVLGAIYFAFFASDLPKEIEYRGQTLGPRERVENNSTRNFDIYSFSDCTNHHILLFVMARDDSATSQQLLDFYVANFKAQGFTFRKKDGRHFGVKGDEKIYMTRAPQIDSAIAYIAKADDTLPKSLRGADELFLELERFSF